MQIEYPLPVFVDAKYCAPPVYCSTAFSALVRSVPDAVLVLVGEAEPLCEEVRQLIKERSLEGRVFILGFQEDPEKIYPAFDVFVLSSGPEPYGRVVIESMAAGVPVISTIDEGPREIIKDGVTGSLVNIEDDSAMSSALLHLYRHPKIMDSYGKLDRSWVEENASFDGYMERLEGHYTMLLEG